MVRDKDRNAHIPPLHLLPPTPYLLHSCPLAYFSLLLPLIIAWLLAANTGSNLAYSMAYLLSAVLGLSYFWAWSSLRGIALRRLPRSRRSQVGQLAEEQFEMINKAAGPSCGSRSRISRICRSITPAEW